MGYVEDVQAMDLSDEVKADLISKHEAEVNPLRESNQSLAARNRREAVEAEVTALADIGFSEAPGLLKYVRRILLSDDEEPGAVLLSDSEMGLSGDQATGATGRQEVSVAGAVREMINLMPRNQEGKLQLSDQGIAAEDTGRPNNGGDDLTDDERETQHKERTQRLSGRSIDRTARSRYRKGA